MLLLTQILVLRGLFAGTVEVARVEGHGPGGSPHIRAAQARSAPTEAVGLVEHVAVLSLQVELTARAWRGKININSESVCCIAQNEFKELKNENQFVNVCLMN